MKTIEDRDDDVPIEVECHRSAWRLSLSPLRDTGLHLGHHHPLYQSLHHDKRDCKSRPTTVSKDRISCSTSSATSISAVLAQPSLGSRSTFSVKCLFVSAHSSFPGVDTAVIAITSTFDGSTGSQSVSSSSYRNITSTTSKGFFPLGLLFSSLWTFNKR